MLRFKKKQYFKLHSFLGVQLSILFFIVCFSGTCAVFSHELDYIFDPEIRVEKIAEHRARFSKITENLEKKYPGGKIDNWIKSEEDYLADIITLKTKDKERLYVYVNPFTGAVQGSSKFNIQRFFRDLHYFMFMPKQIGHYIVLSFGFIIFCSMFTGIMSLGKILKNLRLKTKAKGDMQLRSLHRTLGLYAVPFILVISLTGLWYFIERTDLFKVSRYLDDKTPEELVDGTFKTPNYTFDYDRAFAIAQRQVPNLKFGSFFYTDNLLEVRGKSDFPIVRDRANRVIIDMKNYRLAMTEKVENTPTVKIINNMADPIHFGTFGGLVTKSIWFICGLSVCYLIASGLWFYLKREYRKNGVAKTNRFLYLNLAVLGYLIYCMYSRIYEQYHADFKAYLLVTVYWLALAAAFCYVYIHRLPKKLAGTKKL